MKEILGYRVDEVGAALRMSPRTIEFLIMKAVLEHPEKTLSEIAHDVYTETGSDFALASIFYYLKRNRCSLNFSALGSIFHSYLT